MKMISKIVALVALVAVLSSCAITVPVGATSNAIGNKVGSASGSCFLSVLCFNVDASIKSAAKNGGITKISTVDFKTKNVLGLVITYECIVTGE